MRRHILLALFVLAANLTLAAATVDEVTQAEKAWATRPASSSPSWGPPMKKIMLMLVIRPRSASGAASRRDAAAAAGPSAT